MIVEGLREIVGDAGVLVDPSVTEKYCVDWTGRFRGTALAVVRPAVTDEVAAVIRWCAAERVGIVPQGGNTGLVGGGVPVAGEVVVSLERMHTIESVDATAGHLVAQAGATLAAVQHAALEAGWAYGVDIAARDSATIGGTVATNAGGLRVLRYGDTRKQIVGLEVVTGSGHVITELSGVLRNNVGYHLPSLVCGSEGTLGVITRVRMRLVPQVTERATALLRFDNPSDACVSAETLRRVLPIAESVELFFGDGVRLVCETFDFAPPFATVDGGYVLVEAADVNDPTDLLAAAVDSLEGVSDVAVATDSVRRAALWKHREMHTEAISVTGVPHKLDIAVPPGGVAAFVEAVPAVIEAASPGARPILFGHAGEAALHVNVLGPAANDYAVDEAVLRLVADHGGSISAEHGIGRAKREYLAYAYGDEERALRRGIKAAFDPHGIMNPGVLVV
jgi:FAD/FMN-containing dehydrogenase